MTNPTKRRRSHANAAQTIPPRANDHALDNNTIDTPPPEVKAWINAKAAKLLAEMQRAAFIRSGGRLQ